MGAFQSFQPTPPSVRPQQRRGLICVRRPIRLTLSGLPPGPSPAPAPARLPGRRGLLPEAVCYTRGKHLPSHTAGAGGVGLGVGLGVAAGGVSRV